MLRLIKPVTSVLLVCLFLYLSISWYFSSLIIVSNRPTSDVDTILKTEKSASSIEVLQFESRDSYPFSVWYEKRTPQAHCVIIFIHGWGSSRVGMGNFKQAFSDTTCDFVSYDIRGHGTHTAPYVTGGIKEKEDLLQISQYLVQEKNITEKNIGWFGISFGGSTALQALSSTSFNPGFVVVDSPYSTWDQAIFERGTRMYGSGVTIFRPGVRAIIKMRTGVDYLHADSKTALANTSVPILIFHSQTDPDTASSQSQEIFNALEGKAAIFHHTNWGAMHGKDVEVRPERYQILINQFINQYAPGLVTEEN